MTLAEFFDKYKTAAVAFSGGCDSSYLLYAAQSCGADIHAYYVKSALQPEFELRDAKRLANQLGIPLTVIRLDVLANGAVAANPADRCYHCKKTIFSEIKRRAAEDGYSLLLDGTNASDNEDDRPGTAAKNELSVLSPLKECGLTKDEIRRLSGEAGLFTCDKPAYACLATRIPTGERITAEKLCAVEKSEDFLFSLGFSDFRVRTSGSTAKLQMREEQLGKLLENRTEILTELSNYFSTVTLDLEVRK